MTITQSPPGSLARLGETTCLAVSYLRVSTKEQASKGGRDEGFSIPAQREANLRKARELNAIITEEFVDAGESARKADRPELIRLIEYVKTHDVAYCIVCGVQRPVAAFCDRLMAVQVPMTRVLAAASTTSSVMVSSWLILSTRLIWGNSRSRSRKLPREQ